MVQLPWRLSAGKQISQTSGYGQVKVQRHINENSSMERVENPANSGLQNVQLAISVLEPDVRNQIITSLSQPLFLLISKSLQPKHNKTNPLYFVLQPLKRHHENVFSSTPAVSATLFPNDVPVLVHTFLHCELMPGVVIKTPSTLCKSVRVSGHLQIFTQRKWTQRSHGKRTVRSNRFGLLLGISPPS